MLKAESLFKDPRIAQAKKLLLETILEHSQKIQTIAEPNPALVTQYKEWIEQYAKTRGAKLFYPYLGSGIGKGSLVELLDGSIKYDMITGIGVNELGHSHPDWTEAAFEAALRDTIMQGNLQQNREGAELALQLTRLSGLSHCFFTTSGAMANENALKIAFQKNSPALRILAFEHCFAGRSYTFSQVTDKPSFREGLPLNLDVDYLPFYDPKRPEESTKEAVAQLKKYIERYPKGHALMVFELVQGEGGFYTGTKAFFEPLMKICKENKIAVLADEIQTFGRTTKLFAYQYFGLEKYVDIATVGKMTQICATLFSDEYMPKPGLISQTFTGATSAIFACRALLKIFDAGSFFGEKGRIATIFQRFEKQLKDLEKAYPNKISGPFGIGGMIAFTPLGGERDTVLKFAQNLFEAGVIGFTAGANPTRIRFLVPAVVITDEDIDAVMGIVKNTLLKS